MKICFRCNSVNVVKLSDHKPDCPVVKEKSVRAKDIKDLVNRYNHKNKAAGDHSLGRVNKPGYCKRCGEKAGSLLTHLSKCKGRTETPPPAP